jgi:hypothetical protein
MTLRQIGYEEGIQEITGVKWAAPFHLLRLLVVLEKRHLSF